MLGGVVGLKAATDDGEQPKDKRDRVEKTN
jgi:hypothetical protein